MAVSESLLIAAPLARVWALLDDPDQLPLWMPDVIETVYPDGRPSDNVVGTRFVQRMRDARGITEYQGIVTAYATGRHLAVALTQPLFTLRVAYRLTPTPEGTRLDFTGDLSMHNPLLRLMAIAAWPMTSSILKRQIADLKRVAEAAPPAPAKVAHVSAKKASPAKPVRLKSRPGAKRRKSK